jgi:hypothetical protein
MLAHPALPVTARINSVTSRPRSCCALRTSAYPAAGPPAFLMAGKMQASDQRRQFLAPAGVSVKQVGLVLSGRHQVEQHDADTQRLIPRHARPKLLKAGKQKAGVARFVEIGFIPPAAEAANPGQVHA